jgi:hypothetical protein
MPDRDVKTIQDLIYYQYAKIIARRVRIYDMTGKNPTKVECL